MSTSVMIKQFQKMVVTAALLLGTGNAFSTEYEYRDLLGNTLASQKCATQAEAEAKAKEDATA